MDPGWLLDLPVKQGGAGRTATTAIPRWAGGGEDVSADALTAAEMVTGEVIVAHGFSPDLRQRVAGRINVKPDFPQYSADLIAARYSSRRDFIWAAQPESNESGANSYLSQVITGQRPPPNGVKLAYKAM